MRGEPEQPESPAEGLVWTAIVEQLDHPGSENEWVSVADLPRERFTKHPWSLSGGGAGELLKSLNERSATSLGQRIRVIDRTTHTGNDESYFAPNGTWQRFKVPLQHIIPLVEGEVIRDWALAPATEALFPYGTDLKANLADARLANQLWVTRTLSLFQPAFCLVGAVVAGR